LRRVFSWPTAFLYVGSANRTYFEAFGVQPNRLFACPHFIDVARFAEPAEILDQEAAYWREQLHIRDDCPVLLFAGKFERKKRPVELMRAVLANARPDIVLILVGGGELANEVNEIATVNPDRFRVLPFQNQSRMSVVYRLGDLFILPSAFNETWGLAVNEAIASGRPALISDRVGCASDLSDGSCVRVFPWANLAAMILTINEMTKIRGDLRRLGPQATRKAWDFDVGRSEAALVECLVRVCGS
jgi:glycosyltransferase involved in cell wall biosynthesis